ncbi:hypothetical protein ABEB36_010904 [Hypothenemus hampei]|uniref:C2H2-type domain-containing protein n=1 Tax=Hypothenemus hampei TaxID=57062 RepID=A0ABD1EDF9_HYPHA
MKMLFKGHSTRLEMLIEKIHSNKESSCQDSEISGSTSSAITSENLQEESSDTDEDKDWGEDIKTSKSSEEKFSCGYCPRQFKHKRSRDRHIKLHTGDKKFKCIQCESAFARSDHLKIHMKTHDSKKQFKCQRCNKGYNTTTAFGFHEETHKDSTSKNEELTTSMWQNSREFDGEESADVRSICIYCFQWFSTEELMKEHVKMRHDNDLEEKKQKGDINEVKSDEPSPKRPHCKDPINSQEAFICSCCYEPLPNFKCFLLHMETHVSSINTKMFGENEVSSRAPSMVPLNNYLCCCHCNIFFENKERLQEHLMDNHVVRLYKCSLCEKIFEEANAMMVHLNTMHVATCDHFQCNCSEEPKLFHDRVSAELHFSKYHSSNKFVSEKYLNTNDEYLDRISKIPSILIGSNHRCVYCKEFCKTKNDLQLHLRSHHISEKSRHKCNICDETFGSSQELAGHKLVHCKIVEGNVCVPCKTVLMDEEAFVKHQLKHNENAKSSAKLNLILPYICIVCGQTLQNDKEIELHAKFHLKFLSDQSKIHGTDDVNFTDESTVFNVTILDPSLELQCHLCKKPFPTKEKLQTHLIEHNFFGINQYNCYVCSSVFTGAAGLQNHLLAHNLTEKPYQCASCSAGFFFRTELDNHKYLHNFKMQFNRLTEKSIGGQFT